MQVHYELSGQAHRVTRWRVAVRTARLAAARTGQAVAIWKVTAEGRELVCDVFPNGRRARPLSLHQLPEDLGL